MRAYHWLFLLPALAGCVPPAEVGRRDYQSFCVSCHGADATGNGWAAAHLPVAPADLTTLARRNGGSFPAVSVMGTIDGYSRRLHGGDLTMPEFGPLLEEGDLVMLQTGPDIFTPTPERLVALAAYLETLQE